jgi:hypothetical protein
MELARVLTYRSPTQDPPRSEVDETIANLRTLAICAPWCVHAVNVLITRLLELASS